MLAGWLILGPYHPKFSSLVSTAECLFRQEANIQHKYIPELGTRATTVATI